MRRRILSAVPAAHALFRTHEGNRWVEEDTLLARLSLVRNLLGLAIVVVVALVTEGVHSAEFNPFEHLVPLLATVMATGAAVIAVGAFVLLVTHSGARGLVARRLLIPARTVLLYLVAVCGPFLVGIYGWKLVLALRGGLLVTLALSLILVSVVVPLAVLAVVGSRDSVKSLFRAAEGHPLLAPVATVVVVWLQPQFVLLLDQARGPHDVPGIVLFYGGPLVVTVLSMVEIARLGSVPGLDLRGGPPTVPAPAPAGFGVGFPLVPTAASLVGGLVVTGSVLLLINTALQQQPSGAPVAVNLSVAQGDLDASRISADGKTIAVSTGGNTTYLYRAATGKLLDTVHVPVGRATALAVSPDGRLVAQAGNPGAAGSTHGTPVYVWNVAQRRIAATLPLPKGRGDVYATDLEFSADGSLLLAAAQGSSTVCEWRVSAVSSDAAPATFKAPGQTGHDPGVLREAFIGGGHRIALSTAQGIYLVDAAAGPSRGHPTVFPAGQVFAVSGDGRTLAVSTGFGNVVRVWNVASRTVQRTLTVPGSKEHGTLNSMALNNDGSLLAGGDSTGNVFIWDTGSGELLTTARNQSGYLNTHSEVIDEVTTLQPVPGTSLLLSGDSYGKVTLWNLNSLPGSRSWAAASAGNQ